MPRIRTHPGEILAEEFLTPLGLSARQVAAEIGVDPVAFWAESNALAKKTQAGSPHKRKSQ